MQADASGRIIPTQAWNVGLQVTPKSKRSRGALNGFPEWILSAAFGLTRSVNQVFEGLKGKDFSLTLRGLYHVLDLAVFRESGREECGRHPRLFLVGVWRCLPCAGTRAAGRLGAGKGTMAERINWDAAKKYSFWRWVLVGMQSWRALPLSYAPYEIGMWWAVFCREHLSAGFFTKARRDKHLRILHLHILHVHILHLFTPYICAPSLSLCLSLSLPLSLSLHVSFSLSLSLCLSLSPSLPLSLSPSLPLSLSPSLPLSLSPSLPLSLSPSLPRSLSPSLPRSLAPSLPLSFSPSLACMGSGGALAPWHFVWQAWGLVTSTSLACGRRGTWWHRPHFRWRAHGTLCGRRGTWWHRRSLTTLLYGRRGTTWSRLAPWSRGGVFGGHRRPGTPVAPCIIIIIIIIIISIIILERERTEGRKREKFYIYSDVTHTHPPHMQHFRTQPFTRTFVG